jgi:hypothetical protein
VSYGTSQYKIHKQSIKSSDYMLYVTLAINLVLKELGVYKEKDKDEFDSINLYKFRRMD